MVLQNIAVRSDDEIDFQWIEDAMARHEADQQRLRQLAHSDDDNVCAMAVMALDDDGFLVDLLLGS